MRKLLLINLTLLLVSCNVTKVNSAMLKDNAPVIVYMTKADYYSQVPITLNEAKDRVLSFPAPSDLFISGELGTPIKLARNYLLDRRGINKNSVFTSYTYEEYSKLKSAPSPEELLESVLEKNPFVSVYNCGETNSYKDTVKELNQKIKNGMNGCDAIL